MIKKEFLGTYNIFCSDIHKFGTDAVMLEYFCETKKHKNACDIGTGCGIIPFLMLQSNENIKVTAIDIQSDAIELVKMAIQENKAEDKIFPINCDLKQLPKSLYSKFDLVTMNPPYKRKGSGLLTGIYGIDIARNEIECDLDDICSASYKLLNTNGKFYICQRPERLCEVISSMKKAKIEPKTIRFVKNKSGDKPMLALVSGIKDGNVGNDVLPDLVLKNEDDSCSAQLSEINSVFSDKTENKTPI